MYSAHQGAEALGFGEYSFIPLPPSCLGSERLRETERKKGKEGDGGESPVSRRRNNVDRGESWQKDRRPALFFFNTEILA